MNHQRHHYRYIFFFFYAIGTCTSRFLNICKRKRAIIQSIFSFITIRIIEKAAHVALYCELHNMSSFIENVTNETTEFRFYVLSGSDILKNIFFFILYMFRKRSIQITNLKFHFCIWHAFRRISRNVNLILWLTKLKKK